MAHPQINAVKFRDTFHQAYRANPTPQTALLITNMLLEMATSLDAQADQIGAPGWLRVDGSQLRYHLLAIKGQLETLINGGFADLEIPAEVEMKQVETYLFSGYPFGTTYEDEVTDQTVDATKFRGAAWETATFYNQVGAIDNPLNTTYFGDGIKGWIAKGMTTAIVMTSQAIGESAILNDAVQKWDGFKEYVGTKTDELTKKAMPWVWIGALAVAAYFYFERDKE